VSYKVTRPDGKTVRYEDINRAVADSPDGSIIVNEQTGIEYKVVKR